MSISSHLFILFKEEILHELIEFYLRSMLLSESGKGLLVSQPHGLSRPLYPGNVIIVILYGHEQSIVSYPLAVLFQKCLEFLCPCFLSSSVSLFQYIEPCVIDVFIIDKLGIGNCKSADVLFFEKTFLDQDIKVYEIRISRKTRKALIWRISITGGANRQYLPVFLACIFQKINKSVCFFAKSSYAVIRRKGRDWKKYPCTSFDTHYDLLI